MKREAFDPGLTQKYDGGLRRAINPDGTFNVHRKGTRLRDLSFYQFLIRIPWLGFHAIVLGTYVILNSFFALLYLAVGAENLYGADLTSPLQTFLSAFFFSVHTFTTVGYGTLAPKGLGVNIVAALEAITGLMSFALATGLLYGRFSKPNVRIRFTDNAVIAPYKDITAFEFRIENMRKTNLMELEAKVLLMTVDRSGRQPIRRYDQLTLERDSVYFFPLPWTIVHPIDKSSPLHGKTASDLAAAQAEFLILIKGFDDTFSQVVHARFSYTHDQIVWGAKFLPAFQVNEQGDVILHLDNINLMERVDLP